LVTGPAGASAVAVRFDGSAGSVSAFVGMGYGSYALIDPGGGRVLLHRGGVERQANRGDWVLVVDGCPGFVVLDDAALGVLFRPA
jgi:uncharacterized metal-binding protein